MSKTIFGFKNFFGRLGSAFAVSIGLPILIILLVTPVVVALILFIINSGAYVVPSSSSFAAIENQYIKIEKTASPAGPFQNSDLPKTITYNVTITAKKGILSGVTISDDCKVTKESTSFDCPQASIPSFPETISPANPFSFSYQINLQEGQYNDSLVVNSINVSAFVDGSVQSTSGSSSIVIGKPPTACLSLEGNWPSEYRQIAQSAIVTLASEFPVYMSRVCSSNTKAPVVFSQTCPLGWKCYGAWNNGKIYLMPEALNLGQQYTLFTLAHETGHYLQDMTLVGYGLFRQYQSSISPPDICSYRNTFGNYSESFAETIGRYVSNYPMGCRSGSFRSDYPNNWQFANDKIFR